MFNILPKTRGNNVVISAEGDTEADAAKTALFYSSTDCIVKLPKGKIATIQDLHGYAIIDTPDILMICRKDDLQSIRNFVNDVTLLEN